MMFKKGEQVLHEDYDGAGEVIKESIELRGMNPWMDQFRNPCMVKFERNGGTYITIYEEEELRRPSQCDGNGGCR